MEYSRTETHEGSECLITKDAHIVAVYDDSGSCIGHVATCTTIYKGYMGTDSNSHSFYFTNLEEAIKFCEEHFEPYCEE